MQTSEINVAMERTIEGDYEGAMQIFKNGDMVAGNPEAISYYALCLSELYKNYKKGLALCINALKRDVKNPVIYRNLGKIFLNSGEKERAYKAFDKGLELSERKDAECSKELKLMGLRRTPLVPFLNRENFLNITLGKFSYAKQG